MKTDPKPCARCKESVEPGRKDSYCKPCRRDYNREWRNRTPERRAARQKQSRERMRVRRVTDAETLESTSRKSKLKRFYGLTPDQYDSMLVEQGGVCAICRSPESESHTRGDGRPKHLAVDHDHDTGEVRGLLCSRCNVGIGHLRHDPTLLAAAIDYLTPSV